MLVRLALLVAAMGLVVLSAPPAVADDIYGTAGDDRIVGSQGGDLLVGKAGDDVILGRAGFEDVWAGPGDDVVRLGVDRRGGFVYAGMGDDRVIGSGAVDLQFGQTGDDLLVGGRGGDHLMGGLGSNTMLGGQGKDLITLGSAGTADDDKPMAVGEEWVDAGGRGDQIHVAVDGVVDHIACGPGDDLVIYDYRVDPLDELTDCERVIVTQDPEGRPR